jgi:hypothetical protein
MKINDKIRKAWNVFFDLTIIAVLPVHITLEGRKSSINAERQ